MKTRIFGLVSLIIGMLLVVGTPGLLVAQEPPDPSIVPDHYIITFKDSSIRHTSVDTLASQMGRHYQSDVDAEFTSTVHGFSATVPPNKIAKLEHDRRIASIVPDHYVSIENTALPHITAKTGATLQVAQTTPTGVSRIGAPSDINKGGGIGVAVIDTGIDTSHPDLEANVVATKSCVNRSNGIDDNGHGTHVAGTIAALDNGIGVVGVAPQAHLINVKVLNRNGSGTWASIICGIDWVTAQASTYNIKVANMSLGGSGTNDNNCGLTNHDLLHQAICKSRDAGVTYVVAAGNSGISSANFVPAAYSDAVVAVSALADSDGQSGGLGPSTSYGHDDTFATFSNYGPTIAIGAPGVNILSTWKGGTYAVASGTSMATPHVSGAAADYIQAHPGLIWSQVRDGLIASGETLGTGHTDPSGRHPEPIILAK